MSTPSTSPPAHSLGPHAGPLGLYIAICLDAAVAAVGLVLGPGASAPPCWAWLLAWAYSAPPLRLKRNGWWGNAACGLSV
jgi:chlorophyll synthase